MKIEVIQLASYDRVKVWRPKFIEARCKRLYGHNWQYHYAQEQRYYTTSGYKQMKHYLEAL